MNKARLYAAIRAAGLSIRETAEATGLSRKAFWCKCNGVTEFKQSEIIRLTEVLHLENPSAIFFDKEVS